MNITKLMLILIFSIVNTEAFAYGSSSSSKKSCNKPKFTEFTPIHLTAVKPVSEFSFFASALTDPETIEVKVKKQSVTVVINETNKGYLVTGKLPASLQSTYARIGIAATGTNSCKGIDGWLLKIN